MTDRRIQVQAVVFAVIMVISMIAVGAGGIAAQENGEQIASPSVESGDTLTVDGEGDEPDTFATVSDAVDEADEGDTISVEPGTYSEEIISVDTADLRIESTGNAAETTLDTELGVEIDSDDVVLEGMTITVDDDIVDNGAAPGALVVNGDDTEITDNIINPATDPSASGILVETSAITILGNEITGVEAGNSGGDVSFPDTDETVSVNDRSFSAENRRGIANEIFRENDAVDTSDPNIGLVQVEDAEFETFLGIEHNPGGTTFTDDQTTEVLGVEVQGAEQMEFGGNVDRSIEIRHPDTGSQIEITPEDGEPTVEMNSVRFFNLLSGDGELDDNPNLEIEDEEISVSVTGDEDIFTGVESTFTEFELALSEDGKVVDTTEGRLIGVTYPSDIELEGPTPDGELTTTVTRDDDVSEDYFIEFVVSPRQDVDAGIETEVENTDGDDFLEATVDVSDLPSAEYNLFFDIYEDEAGGLNNRIISLPEVGGLEIIDQGNFEIQEVEIDDDDVTAGEDEIETTVTIENTGDEDTQDVELLKNRIGTFDDERVDSESVSLEAGETTEVPLAYETAVGDDPGVQLDVQTQTSVRRGFIAAVAPGAPEFRITEVDATGDKTQGGDVDLEATVENIGNTDGSVDVEFAFARDIDFDDGSTTEITVDPGETETATVSGTIEQEPRAGDHSVPVDARISTEEGIISSPSTVGTTVAIDYGDIESGVDAATAGDQVLVTAGQYTEAVTIDTDDVVVSGVESGVEVEADGETPFTLAADGTGVSNVAIEDDVDTSAVSITGDDAAVVLADIAGFDTAVEIDNGATGATLIGNDVTVDRMDPAVDVQGSDTSIISNVFVPDEEAAAGDVIRLDEAASDTEIRDNTILTTPLGGNSPAAISVGDDESLAGTEVIRNNFDALAEDDLPVEGESPVDIAVDPEEPANELDATNNYAAGGSLTLESAGINEQDTSDEPLSADFEIADFSIEPDDDVEVGEEVIVSATVENDGDQTGSDNVQFDVDETEFGSGSVTVDPEETEPVEFRFTPGSDEAAVSPLTLGIGLEDAAVEASDEIDVIEPADVTVDETSVDPSEVQAGEPITVGAELENIGDIEASPTVELRVGPNIDGVEGTDYVVVASDDPTIADGDTEPIEFTDATVPSEAIGDDIVQGVNQVGVATAADSDADLLNIVSTPGVFDVTIDDFDDTVEVGETGSVDVTISNTGDEAAQQDVEFVVDGERESLQEFDLDEGADASETFTYQLDSDDVGEIPIEIQSEDDIDTRTVTVEADTPSGSGTGGGGGGGGGGADAAPAGPTAPDTASVTANARERILDTEPDVDGTGVTVEDTALDSIRFDEDTLRGSVDVFELDEVPTDAPALADGQPFVSGFIIELDDDELTDESATLTATLPADQVSDAGAEPEDLVVLHAGDDEYDELETSVEANGDVTVTAETPGFSTFIVTADVDEPEEADDVEEPDADDDPEPADDADDIDEPADDEPDDVDDDTPGFGALVALVALLAAALLATRRRP